MKPSLSAHENHANILAGFYASNKILFYRANERFTS